MLAMISLHRNPPMIVPVVIWRSSATRHKSVHKSGARQADNQAREYTTPYLYERKRRMRVVAVNVLNL
jgi:hypothetical protein